MDRMEELDSISVEHNEVLAPMNISVHKPEVTPKESKRRDKVRDNVPNTDKKRDNFKSHASSMKPKPMKNNLNSSVISDKPSKP